MRAVSEAKSRESQNEEHLNASPLSPSRRMIKRGVDAHGLPEKPSDRRGNGAKKERKDAAALRQGLVGGHF
jgi:hypothetical protein